MCRHLAYVGPPVALSSLLTDPSRALRTQSRIPHHQPPGLTNPDGWGVAWYPDGSGTPHRYRSTTAIWDDDTSRCGAEVATGVLAAARLASPGTALDVRNNAPFISSGWAFSLNGFGFHDEREAVMRAALSPIRREALEGDTDSEILFGLLLDRIDDGATPADAVRDVTALVDPGDDVRLNLLLTDGGTVVATAWGNSLFTREHGDAFLVASEPLDDDPAWTRVPDRTLVDGPRLTPIARSSPPSGGQR